MRGWYACKYIPNLMQYFQCQKCALSLVCGSCGESGHGKSWGFSLPQSVNCCGACASSDRNCLMYEDEYAIWEHHVKKGLSFQDAQKGSYKANLSPGSSLMPQPFIACGSWFHHSEKRCPLSRANISHLQTQPEQPYPTRLTYLHCCFKTFTGPYKACFIKTF
jgi:hypothetical protein